MDIVTSHLPILILCITDRIIFLFDLNSAAHIHFSYFHLIFSTVIFVLAIQTTHLK